MASVKPEPKMIAMQPGRIPRGKSDQKLLHLPQFHFVASNDYPLACADDMQILRMWHQKCLIIFVEYVYEYL